MPKKYCRKPKDVDLSAMGKAAIFLDRDGVLNEERGDYTWRTEDFIIPEGVPETLRALKDRGFLLIVVTNQAGIAKGLYTNKEVLACHQKLQEAVGGIIDDLYYCPYHPSVTESLARKPGSLMLERAIALHGIDPAKSWLIGDRDRDLEAGEKVGVKGIRVENPLEPTGRFPKDLREAARLIGVT